MFILYTIKQLNISKNNFYFKHIINGKSNKFILEASDV